MAIAGGSFKIRLVSVLRDLAVNSIYGAKEVVFENSPQLTESGAVNYAPVEPVHLPGAIQIYKSTPSRTFSINATFISRTPGEAFANLRNIQTLRSWRMPFFGIGSSTLSTEQKNVRRDAETVREAQRLRTGQAPADQLRDGPGQKQAVNQATESRLADQASSDPGAELLGAPPEVLYLYAYSSNASQTSEDNGLAYRSTRWVNLNKIPVVLTSLSISFPDDVDYIPALHPTNPADYQFAEPCPVKIPVSIELVETHSPAEFEKFDLKAFKQGELVYW